MVATVGSIAVDLVTNVTKFVKDFNSAATTVDRQSAKMSTSLSTVDKSLAVMGTSVSSLSKSFLAGIAGGAVVGGLFSLTGAITRAKDAVKQFDDIADAAVATGLNNDFFQAINFGAVEAGVGMESLTGTLAGFARNAGLAAEGKGRMTSALRALNPGLLEAINNAGSMEEKLKVLANALASETDATTRAAIGVATLGDGWRQLLPVFDKGAAGLEKLRQRAHEAGVVISDEMLAAAGPLEEKLNAVSFAINQNLNTAFVNAAPVIVGATGLLKSFTDQLNKLITTNKQPLPTGWAEAIAPIVQMDLSAAREQLSLLEGDLAKAKENLATALRVMEQEGPDFERAVELARLEVERVERTIANLSTSIDKLVADAVAGFAKFGEAVGKVAPQVGTLAGALGDVATQLSNVVGLLPGLSGIGDVLGGVGDALGSFSSSAAAGAASVPRPPSSSAVDPMADLTKAISDALAGSQQALTEAVFQASQPTSQEQMAWDAQIQAADATKRLVELAADEKSAGGTAVTQEEVAAINATTNAIYETSYETQRIEEEIRAATEATEESISSQQAAFDAIGYDTQRMGDSLAGIDPMTGELVSLAYAEISASNAIQASVDALNATTANGLAGLGDLVSGVFSGAGTTLTSSGGGQMGYGSSVEQNIQFINDRLLADMGPSLSGVVPANEVGGFYAEGGSWEFGGNQRGDQTPYTLMGNPGEVGMVFSDAQQRLINSMEAAIEQSSRGNGERPIQVVINADSRTTGERVRMAAIEGVRQGVRQADAVKGRGRG